MNVDEAKMTFEKVVIEDRPDGFEVRGHYMGDVTSLSVASGALSIGGLAVELDAGSTLVLSNDDWVWVWSDSGEDHLHVSTDKPEA